MSVKDIHIKPIDGSKADDFIRRHHYSGTVVQNSQLHLGAYYKGSLEGVMQFGPSLDKSKLIGLVEGTEWNEFMELNRMAFSEKLPKNSESRSLSIAFKLFKKHAPQVKWIVSFADAAQCGDGAIYRASNFILTGIKETDNLAELTNGDVIHKMTLESSPDQPRPELDGRSYYDITGGSYDFAAYIDYVGAKRVAGYQLRYIYFIDKDYRDKLTVDEIPYEKIDETGAGMYKGEKISIEERKP